MAGSVIDYELSLAFPRDNKGSETSDAHGVREAGGDKISKYFLPLPKRRVSSREASSFVRAGVFRSQFAIPKKNIRDYS